MKPNLSPVKSTENQVEYVPLGNSASIKLSITIVKHYLCTPTKTGKLCSDRDAVRFIMLCKSRGLDPFQGDAFLLGYEGQQGAEFSLITAHQAFLKRAETHKEFDGLESGVIIQDAEGKLQANVGDFMLEEDTLIGAWANVHFKTRKYPVRERIALKPFDKGFGRWKIDPAGMLVKCAQSSALRTAFPTLLCGMYLRDEIEIKSDTPTLTGTGDLDLPAIPADTGVIQGERLQEELETRGEPPKPSPAPNGKKSPTEELQAVIEGAGYNFTDFRAWCDESGNIADASSLPDWSAVKASDATRLLRAKVGLLNGIATMKGEGAH